MANPAVLVQKEDLLTRVWGYESGAEDNNVEAYISFLRKEIRLSRIPRGDRHRPSGRIPAGRGEIG